MTIGIWIGLAAVLALAAGAMVIYNGLVRAKQHVREGWGAIDVQLQRRASLIPNLVEAVKGYAEYERGTLTKLVEARGALGTAQGPAAAARANAELSGALQTFFAVAEAYPDLKATERFAALQADLADTENKVAYARNYYNGAVETYNNHVQTFPGMLVAGAAGFAPAEFFSATEAARQAVSV
ncbi:MAG: LemA family protein [Vicinamibacterales bacterium]